MHHQKGSAIPVGRAIPRVILTKFFGIEGFLGLYLLQ